MSLGLLLLGQTKNSVGVGAIVSIGRACNLRVSPSKELGYTGLVGFQYDFMVAVEAPESQTATELELECGCQGMEARLVKFINAISEDFTRLGVLWYWEHPRCTSIRRAQGSIMDLVTLLSQPEGWGVAVEVSPGVFDVSYEVPLLFVLTGE